MKSHLHHEKLVRVISVHESIQEAVAAIELLYDIEAPIRSAAQVIEQALLSGKKVLTCGNGGSAADSSHLATEIACRFLGDRRPFPAISLSADGGLLTATGNDYSFEEIFARQVIAFGTSGDVLIALSTSGQSENVRRALEQAKALDLHSIAILGRDGGRCRGIASIDLIVPHSSTARIQEAHKVIIHLLCELIEPALSQAKRIS
ncbi:MAG TPA: SIS domain-containing protein [Chthoniobacterales bacterium]|nr:SIS domain-containing protein [Chthoniobacterales bacterium]